MRISDIIIDSILDSRIFEQAFRRRDAETRISSLTISIFSHLIKVLKWQDETNYNKNCSNIDEWIRQIQIIKLKGNNKPSQSDYFQWMFNDVVSNEETVIRNIKSMSRTYILPVIRTDDEVFQIIKNILYQLSYDLPVNKFESILDCLPEKK